MAGREQFDRSKRQTRETRVIRLDGVKQVLCKVNLAAFEHRQALAPGRLDNLHVDIRKTLRVTMQKLRKDAFDMLRRSGDDQRAHIALAQELRALADGGCVVQQAATVAQKLLPFAR